MKTRFSLVFFMSILFLSGVFLAQGKTNLNGTWEGETYVEGGPVLVFTLVLQHKDSTISGNINDDAGYVDSEISEAKLEKDIFTFKAVAQTPEGEIVLDFKVTVAGDSMEGGWEAENGAYSGSWSATRKTAE